MEKKTAPCGKCGAPAKLIPPNGEWGKKVISRTTGKEYYPFFKCEACNWSLSSDPNPRKFTRKPEYSPKIVNNSVKDDRFDLLVAMLGDIQAALIQLQSSADVIEVEIKTRVGK